MADIRIKDLPLATGPTEPMGTDFLAIDGLTTRKTPISALGDVAVPIASQAEAEAGVNATKRMTPLTTKQSIASQVGTVAGTIAAGDDARIINSVQNTLTLTAGTGLTGGGDLSANRSFALSSTSLTSLGKADTAVQRAGDTMTGDLRVSGGLLSAFKNIQTIPTTPDNAGMAVSFNRSNADGETNIRNMFVNTFGPSKAFVFSQITTTGSAETDLLTIYRNGQIKNGGGGWLEPLAGQTETIAQLAVLSRPGSGMPIIGAVRTSDLVAPAYFAGQGLFGYCINDRARTGDFDTTFAGWGGYFEMRRKPGSGRSHGIEIGTVNENNGTDPVVRPDPFDYGQAGQISSLWNSAGRPDVGPNQQDIDVGAGWIQNGPSGTQVSYSVGLFWGDKSVREVGGIAPLMRMPTRYQLEWYTGAGALKGYIRSEQSGAATLNGMVIRDTTIDQEFGGIAKVKTSATGVRSVDQNGGFDANSTYFPSATPTQQWQFQSGTALFVNANTGTTATPIWSNRGQFNLTTGAYSSVSDERLKKNFENYVLPENMASRLADAVSLYNMKESPDGKEKELGFIAQRLDDILPEALSNKDGTLFVNVIPIVAALSSIVADLEVEIKALKKELSEK